MPLSRPAAAFLLMAGPIMAGTSMDYTATPEAFDSGGLRGSSLQYTLNASCAAGTAGGAPDYTVRTGFAAQLGDAALLALSAAPTTVNETNTCQLGARVGLDDGTLIVLAATDVAWSIQSGPVSSISQGGLGISGAVYQNTAATIQGMHQGLTSSLQLTVLEVIPDNFGVYAGDRLPDPWQVQFLGLANPDGRQNGNPDGDAYSNLLEFAFGTDPANPVSGPGDLRYAAGVISQRGQPILRVEGSPAGVSFQTLFGRRKDHLSTGLSYTVQFSAYLLGWQNGAGTPAVVASDAEMDAVSVRYPFFLSDGRKAQFFRVRVTLP